MSLLILSVAVFASCTSKVDVSRPARISKAAATDPTPTPSPTATYSLTFTGDSNSSSVITSRFFKDTSGTSSAYKLSGTCDPNKGTVTLSGTGLQSSTTATCAVDGTFSIDIYHSSSSNSPKFWSYDTTLGLYGGRSVSATQGTSSTTTKIFLASTTHTSLNQISTPAAFSGMASSAANYNVLTDNINMSGQSYTTIATLSGVLDGNGYAVSNLSFTGGGLFSSVASTATVAVLRHEQVLPEMSDFLTVILALYPTVLF